MFYLVFLVVVWVAGGMIYNTVRQNRVEKQNAQQAFKKARELYDQGKYDQAITTFDKVSESHTPKLHQLAKRMVETIKAEKDRQDVVSDRLETEDMFRQLLSETRAASFGSDESGEPTFDTFRKHLNALPDSFQNTTWYAHYERSVDRLQELFEQQGKSTEGVRNVSKVWKEVKEEVRTFRDQNQYGQAANRVLRFQFVYPESGLAQEADVELRKVETNAEVHLNSKTEQVNRFLEDGNREKALSIAKQLQDHLYSYFDGLTTFYLDAVEQKRNVQRKLDKTSDSS